MSTAARVAAVDMTCPGVTSFRSASRSTGTGQVPPVQPASVVGGLMRSSLPGHHTSSAMPPLACATNRRVTTGVGAGGGEQLEAQLVQAVREVGVSAEHVVAVAESVAELCPEVKQVMMDACKEARATASAVEKLCSLQHQRKNAATNVAQSSDDYDASIIRAARCLLGSITRVLLLTDNVVVKQILLSKNKMAVMQTSRSSQLEDVNSFSEFVKSFSQFAQDMVELCKITSLRSHHHTTDVMEVGLKHERHNSSISAATQLLSRFSTLLHVSSKAVARHPDCAALIGNRDTVFCQMRRAVDLIHFVVKDAVCECAIAYGIGERALNGGQLSDLEVSGHVTSVTSHTAAAATTAAASSGATTDGRDNNRSIIGAMQSYCECLQLMRDSVGDNSCSSLYADRLRHTFELISERSQDFTDSPYVSHPARQHILTLSHKARQQLERLVLLCDSVEKNQSTSPCRQHEDAVEKTLVSTENLLFSLQTVAMEQASEFVDEGGRDEELISQLKMAAMTARSDCLEEINFRFQDHSDHVQEVCKLLGHVVGSYSVQTAARHTEINVAMMAPQLIAATNALTTTTSCKTVIDNFQAFAEMWSSLVADVKVITRESADYVNCVRSGQVTTRSLTSSQQHSRPNAQAGKQHDVAFCDPVLLTSARGGTKTSCTSTVTSAVTSAPQQQLDDPFDPDCGGDSGGGVGGDSGGGVGGDSGGGVGGDSGGVGGDPGGVGEDNEIMRRARNLSHMTEVMGGFMRGDGPLRTTQDLFTQAEYFTEECNQLYKVVRQFSYQVPQGSAKKQLLEQLQLLPTHVQQLQFTVKSSTVGRAATIAKVDDVMRGVRTAIDAISGVVRMCLTCAEQYNLDFRGLNPRGGGCRTDGGEGSAGGATSAAAGGVSQSSSSDANILQLGSSRRGKGDPRRTRVSFLLF